MSSFPAMISNEPPPIDSDEAEEEDFDDEFRSNGLRLDISADQSPFCSPRKLSHHGSSNHNKVSPLSIPDQGSQLTPSVINGGSISPEKEARLDSNKVPSSFSLADEYLTVVDAKETETTPSQITSIIKSTDGWEHSNGVDGDDDLDNQDQPCCDEQLSQEANSLEVIQVPFGETEEESGPSSSETGQVQIISFNGNCVLHSSEAKTEDEEPLQGIRQDLTTDPITENSYSSLQAADEVQINEASIPDSESTSSYDNISPGVIVLEDYDSFGEFDTAPFSNTGENVQNSVEEVATLDLFPADSSDYGNYSDCQGFNAAKAAGVDNPEEDFGDFSSNFNSESIGVVLPGATFPIASVTTGEEHQLSSQAYPPVVQIEDDDDDFGDFASSGAKDLTASTSSQTSSVATPLVHPPPAFTSTPSLIRRDSLHSEGRLDALVKSVFTQPHASSLPSEGNGRILEPIDKQLGNSASNAAWTHIQEFEDSHCLLHKWPRSGVYHLLMKSLNIDSSNIIYSAKYGTIQVPKFASSLVDTPLQPQSISSTPFDFPVEDGIPIGRLDDDSPDEPGILEPKLVSDPKLNKEAFRILEQLPDLSYMLAKTLVFPRHSNF